YPWQSGLINAVPVAVTASKGSDKLTIEGLTPSTVEAVAPGDVFSIGTNLYMAVTAANTDANGQASITIRPRLRKTAFKGETARFDKPTGRFSLSSSEAFSSAFNADGFAGNTATLSLIEVPDLGEAS
ncbi:MAG: hypothetical protein KI785_15770, partial [Devosiaceae bacterium]|nr:hypothetical protein [Devosiaceae bacterium MH13]